MCFKEKYKNSAKKIRQNDVRFRHCVNQVMPAKWASGTSFRKPAKEARYLFLYDYYKIDLYTEVKLRILNENNLLIKTHDETLTESRATIKRSCVTHGLFAIQGHQLDAPKIYM